MTKDSSAIFLTDPNQDNHLESALPTQTPPPQQEEVYYEAGVRRLLLRPQHNYPPNDEIFFRINRVAGVYLQDLIAPLNLNHLSASSSTSSTSTPPSTSAFTTGLTIDDSTSVALQRYPKSKIVKIAVDWPGLDMPPLSIFQMIQKDGERRTHQDLAKAVAIAVHKFYLKVTGKGKGKGKGKGEGRWKLNKDSHTKPKPPPHPLESKDYMGNPRMVMPILPAEAVDLHDLRLISIQFRKGYWIPILGVDDIARYRGLPGIHA